MKSEILIGDNIKVLKTLETASVNSIITSPPYYGLRDYGMNEQIGLEKTPKLFIEKLVCVFRECKRVLKNDGTLWINIGDFVIKGIAGEFYPCKPEIFEKTYEEVNS